MMDWDHLRLGVSMGVDQIDIPDRGIPWAAVPPPTPGSIHSELHSVRVGRSLILAQCT
jgi:hypothetical protein